MWISNNKRKFTKYTWSRRCKPSSGWMKIIVNCWHNNEIPRIQQQWPNDSSGNLMRLSDVGSSGRPAIIRQNKNLQNPAMKMVTRYFCCAYVSYQTSLSNVFLSFFFGTEGGGVQSFTLSFIHTGWFCKLLYQRRPKQRTNLTNNSLIAKTSAHAAECCPKVCARLPSSCLWHSHLFGGGRELFNYKRGSLRSQCDRHLLPVKDWLYLSNRVNYFNFV